MSKMLMSSVAAVALMFSGAAMAQSADHDRSGASSGSNMSNSTGTSGSTRASSETEKGNATSTRKQTAETDRAGASKNMKADKESSASDQKGKDHDAKADAKGEKTTRQATDRRDDDRASGRADTRKDADRGTDTKAMDRAADRGDRDGTRGRASLDETQQSKISETLRSQHVENIAKADFDVRVGGTVPSRYHSRRLPDDIVSIVPQYRGYDYLVADNNLVIVDPHTHRIVYTMEEGRSAAMDKRSTGCR